MITWIGVFIWSDRMPNKIGMEEGIKVDLYIHKYNEFRKKEFPYQACVSASSRLQPSIYDNLVIEIKKTRGY